ncbi:DUF6074 family protein [Brucella sp. 2280]|uniref:DUF6074 family protein n=1 Tax=Brucella sp. 2280 TaxID=2592625 RepID=UPI001297EA60|nr:DUF6074 family protein [Brucella sp. 2280]QGA57247.1 hypothetical protein GHC20_09240 [Brucella sp. 2280]
MKKNDLPLFAWTPPCKVLVFPLESRIGKVRRTASMLYRKHGEDAELYWKQVIAANRKHLERIGLSEKEVWTEIAAFSQAVQSELVRISLEWKDTGGVA